VGALSHPRSTRLKRPEAAQQPAAARVFRTSRAHTTTNDSDALSGG